MGNSSSWEVLISIAFILASAINDAVAVVPRIIYGDKIEENVVWVNVITNIILAGLIIMFKPLILPVSRIIVCVELAVSVAMVLLYYIVEAQYDLAIAYHSKETEAADIYKLALTQKIMLVISEVGVLLATVIMLFISKS